MIDLSSVLPPSRSGTRLKRVALPDAPGFAIALQTLQASGGETVATALPGQGLSVIAPVPARDETANVARISAALPTQKTALRPVPPEAAGQAPLPVRQAVAAPCNPLPETQHEVALENPAQSLAGAGDESKSPSPLDLLYPWFAIQPVAAAPPPPISAKAVASGAARPDISMAASELQMPTPHVAPGQTGARQDAPQAATSVSSIDKAGPLPAGDAGDAVSQLQEGRPGPHPLAKAIAGAGPALAATSPPIEAGASRDAALDGPRNAAMPVLVPIAAETSERPPSARIASSPPPIAVAAIAPAPRDGVSPARSHAERNEAAPATMAPQPVARSAPSVALPAPAAPVPTPIEPVPPARPGASRAPIAVAGCATAGLASPPQVAVTLAAAPLQQDAIDMRHREWTGRMVERIEALRDAAPAGETRIRLVPELLGAVDVTIREEGDRVHVHITAETAAARQLLSEAQPRLAELAEARGIRLGQTSVDGGAAGQGSHGQRQDAAPRQSARPSRAPAADDPAPDDRIA